MINRIKQAIILYYGEREMFLQVLKNGDWERYESWLNIVQHRIEIDQGFIDLTELGGNRYRVATSPRGDRHMRWRSVEFADTAEHDRTWHRRLENLLREAGFTKTVDT